MNDIIAPASSSAPADPRRLAALVLADVLDRRRMLDDALDARPELAALAERDRGFVRLLVATTLRRLGQADDVLARFIERPLPAKAAPVRHVLRLGVVQMLFLNTPAHAAIATAVEMVKGDVLAGYAGLVNAVLRRVAREGAAIVQSQDALRLNIPAWLWQSWLAGYGEAQTRAIAQASLTEAPLDLSAADPAAWAAPLGATLLPTGTLRLSGGGNPVALPGFAEGGWWVQDMAAALPVRLLGAVQGLRVADLCAAPGGKTLQLAAAGAHVTAIDLSGNRLKRLRANLERTGLSAQVVEGDVSKWQPDSPFDAVLLDAPCTATGTLRRHPDGLHLKSPADAVKLGAAQARLLRAAAAMVRPGGTLVYCVCSLQPEEGEGQIAAFLTEAPHFRRAPVAAAEIGGLDAALSADGDVRTLPHLLAEQGGMDAFFAARLIRQPAISAPPDQEAAP